MSGRLDVARALFIANAVVVLPVAVLGLIDPVGFFTLLGIALDAGGAVVARAYASTLLGLGIVYLLLRDASEPRTVLALVVGSLLFHVAETAVQAASGLAGTTSSMIWATLAVHAAMAVASAVVLARVARRTAPAR